MLVLVPTEEQQAACGGDRALVAGAAAGKTAKTAKLVLMAATTRRRGGQRGERARQPRRQAASVADLLGRGLPGKAQLVAELISGELRQAGRACLAACSERGGRGQLRSRHPGLQPPRRGDYREQLVVQDVQPGAVGSGRGIHQCGQHRARAHALGQAARRERVGARVLAVVVRDLGQAGVGEPLADVPLEAVRAFTVRTLETAGDAGEDALRTFLASGYTAQNALEVVLGIGTYTLSTLANRLTRAPLDEQLGTFAWQGAS